MNHMDKFLFWIRPGHWGLKGKTLETAKIDYMYDSGSYKHTKALLELELKYNTKTKEEFEAELLELNYKCGIVDFFEYKRQTIAAIVDPTERAHAQMDFEFEYNIISEWDYKMWKIEQETPKNSVGYKLAVVDLKLSFGSITDQQAERERATIKGEPYIRVIDGGVKGGKPFMEFDWNTYFIDECKSSGIGNSMMDDEEVVEAWYQRFCMRVAFEDGMEELEKELISRQQRNSNTLHIDGNKGTYS